MEALGFDVRQETVLRTLTDDALKTSDIEGERLDRDDVRSSLALRLGIPTAGVKSKDKRADAIAAVVLDATQGFHRALTAERLFSWHTMLFQDVKSGYNPIRVGNWRDDSLGPMRVVSGPIGRETIHFEAPPASRVPLEMERFLEWFEKESLSLDPVLKAAVAHIWFVTIHPFDDGNGRIARAIADLALARSEATSQRFYSMSARLRVERDTYYQTLEATQKGNLDITQRLAWFLSVLDQALADAEASLATTIRKARFWERLRAATLNARQRMMLNQLLDGFVGKLTSSKWAQIAKCSQDTALRDIEALLSAHILARTSGGRSTHYDLVDHADQIEPM